MTNSQDPVFAARSRLASASRRRVRDANPEAITEARRDLHAAILRRRICEGLAATPPISADQRADLAALLLSGGASA